jgi:thioredoxin reductase (NADPH)
MTSGQPGPTWDGKPLPFETSVPGVFAVGDVRSGSMKRVAAATGEGASAIASVHKAIGALI